MTSDQKSAPAPWRGALWLGIESPGGAYHPHRIEVQEFSTYGLIVDLRSEENYLHDHLPGAVRTERAELPDRIGRLAADESILLYDGDGGRMAQRLAEALRAAGREVDVLPGGWINYRRWVEAGLQVVPRLFQWRVIDCRLGSEAAHVLRALRDELHQVVDVGAMAGWRRGRLVQDDQPSQALFESRLLEALRQLDGRCPVWVEDLQPLAGGLTMPSTMLACLKMAPITPVEVDLEPRVRQWRLDEPILNGASDELLRTLEGMDKPPPAGLMDRWRRQAAEGQTEAMLGSLLVDWIDAGSATAAADPRHRLPALVAESLAPEALRKAVRATLPASS